MVAAHKPWDNPGLKQYQTGQPRRFQAKNTERSMVAACKPWDAPDLRLLQEYKCKLNIIEINVRIDTDSFCFHLVSYLYLMTT